MNLPTFLANVTRRVEQMFPGYFPGAKHNHYKDFGWPTNLTFKDFFHIYRRNGLANAGVNKTILKTWQDNPELRFGKEGSEKTTEELNLAKVFEDLMIWQAFAEADRRAMVGGYAAVILRLRDSKRFHEPVDRVPGGLEGLAEVIPAWGGVGAQLEVAEWDYDEQSENYGKPKMFSFNEAAVEGKQQKIRNFNVHPDRVLIWSKDGTVHCASDLEAGHNDLLDAEKVKGAGGEGFYKAARGNPVLEASPDLKFDDMAKAMNVPVEELVDKMNAQVEDFQKGFDKLLMVQGMQAKTLPITLPTGDTYFNSAVNSFAASILIPVKILLGSQTGERASTEDANEWNQVNNARRVNFCKPRIRAFISRLQDFGIIVERDWVIEWADLTEANKDQKIDRASKMADINQKQKDEPVWAAEEIRKAAGDDENMPTGLSAEGDDL